MEWRTLSGFLVAPSKNPGVEKMRSTTRRRVAFSTENVVHLLSPRVEHEAEDSPEAIADQLRELLREQCRLVVEQRKVLADLKRERATRRSR
jgi:hypothetical protein